MEFSGANADIKILVVDDDSTCLAIVAAVLRNWNYQVVTVKDPREALITLRMEGGFDLVVADVHMPEMNGFQLQQHIITEFQLPVVLMSVDDRESLVARGVDFGTTLFISKPVSVNDVRNLWQIAASKKDQNSNRVVTAEEGAAPVSGTDVGGGGASVPDQAASAAPTSPENAANKTSEITKEGDLTFKIHKLTGKKKLVWTAILHYKFLDAIRILGLNHAVPKKILDIMDVPGITRENVASHLQKYRMFLRRVAEVTSSIQRSVDWRFGSRSWMLSRNINAARSHDMFSLINEHRFRAGQTSLGLNITPELPPTMRPAAPIFSPPFLFSDPRNQPLPGYGQSSLLSPHLFNFGRPPFMPTNVVNPIYQRNYITSLPPLVIRGNDAITSPPAPTMLGGGGSGRMLPQTYAATASETNRNEMMMGAPRPNQRRMSGRFEVPDPLDLDFLFDDNLFKFLMSDLTENENDHASQKSPSSTNNNSTGGGNPLSPLFVADATVQPQTDMPPLPPSHPIIQNGNGNNNTGGDDTSLSNFSMFDSFLAEQYPVDGGLGDLITNNENENAVNSNFSSAVNQNQTQYEDLPTFDHQVLETRTDEEFIESLFDAMPFSDKDENGEDDTSKN